MKYIAVRYFPPAIVILGLGIYHCSVTQLLFKLHYVDDLHGNDNSIIRYTKNDTINGHMRADDLHGNDNSIIRYRNNDTINGHMRATSNGISIQQYRYGSFDKFGHNATDIVSITGGIQELCLDFGMKFWRNTMYSYINPDYDSFTKYIDFFNHPPHILINISNFTCHDLYMYGTLGTANIIMAFYELRLLARQIGKVDISITCSDAIEQQNDLVVPWVMGQFTKTIWSIPAKKRIHPLLYEARQSSFWVYMLPDMIYELRRMAIAMVGIPYSGHPSEQWANENLWMNEAQLLTTSSSNSHRHSNSSIMQVPTPKKDSIPVYPNVVLDDAVIHFRCGDIMDIGYSERTDFGFYKFQSLTEHISPDARSIGIITQPFLPNDDNNDMNNWKQQQRNEDKKTLANLKCQKIVNSLVDYISFYFRENNNNNNVRISIRNDAKETITLALARMIMANQTVVGISSFGLLGGLTTFGTGYIPMTDNTMNDWLVIQLTKPDIAKQLLFKNNIDVQLIQSNNATFLSAKMCNTHWGTDGEKVINWLNDYNAILLPEENSG